MTNNDLAWVPILLGYIAGMVTLIFALMVADKKP